MTGLVAVYSSRIEVMSLPKPLLNPRAASRVSVDVSLIHTVPNSTSSPRAADLCESLVHNVAASPYLTSRLARTSASSRTEGTGGRAAHVLTIRPAGLLLDQRRLEPETPRRTSGRLAHGTFAPASRPLD